MYNRLPSAGNVIAQICDTMQRFLSQHCTTSGCSCGLGFCRRAAQPVCDCFVGCLCRRPTFWYELLQQGGSGHPGASSKPHATNFLAAAAHLQRVDVSAASSGTSFGNTCASEPVSDFPGLAWLPDKLRKADLLIRWLAVTDPVLKGWQNTR